MALNSMLGYGDEDLDLVVLAEKILDRIHSTAVPILQVELGKKGLVLSERLYNELSRTTNIMHQDRVIEYVLDMNLYGQFVDYRKMRYTGTPPKTTADAVAKIQKELRETNDVAKRDELKTALAGAKVAADNATVAVEKMRKSIDITHTVVPLFIPY